MGISIGFHGFHPNRPYNGQKDIFNHTIIQGNSNLIDALSAFAGILMGEGNEQTPLAVINDIPFIAFQDRPPTQKEIASLRISLAEDIFSPLLTTMSWKQKRK